MKKLRKNSLNQQSKMKCVVFNLVLALQMNQMKMLTIQIQNHKVLKPVSFQMKKIFQTSKVVMKINQNKKKSQKCRWTNHMVTIIVKKTMGLKNNLKKENLKNNRNQHSRIQKISLMFQMKRLTIKNRNKSKRNF